MARYQPILVKLFEGKPATAKMKEGDWRYILYDSGGYARSRMDGPKDYLLRKIDEFYGPNGEFYPNLPVEIVPWSVHKGNTSDNRSAPSAKHLSSDAADFRYIRREAHDIERAVKRLEKRDKNMARVRSHVRRTRSGYTVVREHARKS